MVAVAVALALAWLKDVPSISDLNSMSKALSKESDGNKAAAIRTKISAGVEAWITTEAPKTGAEFFNLASLIDSPTNFFESSRVRYELTLTAAKLGDSDAQKALANSWDLLVVSIGRNRRLAVEVRPGSVHHGLYQPAFAPKSVLMFFRDPARAKSAAANAKNDPEVQALVDADQKAREGDWSKFTTKDFERLEREDTSRLKRIKQIVGKGALRTGDDYFNAALVCQHGSEFEDYALAHELSVASMILGHKSGAWLSAASYDRMLLNMGHRQRFGTQFSIQLGKMFLSPYDGSMINETERKILVGRTLAEAQARANSSQ